MEELFKRLWTDPDYFAARLRMLVFALGTAFSTGIITLDRLSQDLGKAGWYLGLALQVGALMIANGDKTPAPLKKLDTDEAQALADKAKELAPK